MILTLNDYYQEQDCPELINAFDIEPCDYQTGHEDADFTTSTTMTDGPQDVDTMDAETYSLYLAYGDSF